MYHGAAPHGPVNTIPRSSKATEKTSANTGALTSMGRATARGYPDQSCLDLIASK
jgi:hypothetical protein